MAKGIHIDIKTTVYPMEAIYQASYMFIDRAYVRLEERPKSEIRVHLEPKEDKTDKGFKKLGGEFQNELIHQCVRTKVAENNKKIREYIVTRALLSAQSAQEIPSGFPVAGGPDGQVTSKPGPDGDGTAPDLGPDGKPITNNAGAKDGEMVSQREDDPSPGANLDRVNRKETPSDDALAGEIQKLLSEIDSGGDAEDPLGITAPWEEQSVKKVNGGAPAEKDPELAADVKAAEADAGTEAEAKYSADEPGKDKDDLADEIKALLEAEASAQETGSEGK